MNTAPLAETAEALASQGRYGDTMLMHVNPAEVAGIASLTPGGLTFNPETGQPEAFAFLAPLMAMGGAWAGSAGALGAIGLGSLGTGALAMGAGAGLGGLTGSLLSGENFKDSLKFGAISGLTSGLIGSTLGGQSLMGTEKAMEPFWASAAEKAAAQSGAGISQSAIQGVGQNATTTNPMGVTETAFNPNYTPSVSDHGAVYPVPEASPALPLEDLPFIEGGAPENLSAITTNYAPSSPPADTGIMSKIGGAWDKATPVQKGLVGLTAIGAGGTLLGAGDDDVEELGSAGEPFNPVIGQPPEARTVDPYGEGITRYGFTPREGEHRFFKPYNSQYGYAAGGQVAPPQAQQAMAALQSPEAQQSLAETGGIEGQIITETKMALMGQHPAPEAAVNLFIQMFGPEAFEQLKAQVAQEMNMGRQDPAMQGQVVQGPAGTDNVPAIVDGQEPARLTAGEYVLPTETVDKVGKPNLDAIVEQTTGTPPNNAEPRRGILPRMAA